MHATPVALQNFLKCSAVLPTGFEEVPSRQLSWKVFRWLLTPSTSLQQLTPEFSNTLYLNQLNSLVTSSHQPCFWRPVFIWLREYSAPHLEQDLLRKHTNYLTISLPLDEGEGENRGHKAQFWRKLRAAAAAQKHLGLIIHTQQNPGWAHPTEGTHKRFTSPSPTATRQSSRTSEPHLLQTSNESSTTLCRDDWNKTLLCYFLVLFL